MDKAEEERLYRLVGSSMAGYGKNIVQKIDRFPNYEAYLKEFIFDLAAEMGVDTLKELLKAAWDEFQDPFSDRALDWLDQMEDFDIRGQ